MKIKLLCVEDDSINAFIMEKLLGEDFDIVIAPDGESCLELIIKDNFDVILLDINLGRGKMDGIEILSKLRENSNYSETPVFALTSYALPGDEEKFLNHGFDFYFSKPIDRGELIAAINHFLDDRPS